MKTFSLITAAISLVLGVAVSHAATMTGSTHVLTRISNETGVPVDTLRTEKATTGLGYGGLEKANLLAKASGQSFDTIAGKFKAGEGWGKIAHDYGLKLGKVVGAAHRSSKATLHAHNAHSRHAHTRSTTHRKNASRIGKSHTSVTKSVGPGPSVKSGREGFHGMSAMGHAHGRH
jgi:hypothetical protein